MANNNGTGVDFIKYLTREYYRTLANTYFVMVRRNKRIGEFVGRTADDGHGNKADMQGG